MKKIFTSLLLLTLAFVLFACDPQDDNPTDTTAPVILGADSKTITVGTPFDPLEGVSATDDVDGTITLTASNVTGSVDINAPGTYTLVYKVSDKAGNEASKNRVITVLSEAPLGNLVGGDFASTTLPTGWAVWSDTTNNYTQEYSIVDGVFVLDIKTLHESDDQWWAIQLQYNKLILDPFVSYKLSFKIKADDKRYMNHQIQGGGIPESGKAYGELNVVEITTDWQTIEQDFYVKGAGVDSQLQFSFGNFGEVTGVDPAYKSVATKVYIDDVQITAGPELENQAPTIVAPNLVIKVGQATALKQGITVQDDFTIIQVADVTVVQVSTDPIIFNPQNPQKGVYTFDVTAVDDEGLSTTIQRTITVAEPWNRPFDFVVSADGAWDVNSDLTVPSWFLRQIDIEEGSPYLTYVDNEDGSVEISIDSIPADDWKSVYKMAQVQYFAGTYTVTFEAKADTARLVRVAIENAGLAANVAYQDVQITDAWTTITLTYLFETDQYNKGFEFYFGSLVTNRTGTDTNPRTEADDILTTVYLRNFNVVYAE